MRGIWLLLLLTGWCSAQQGTLVLAGSVVNTRTGEPVTRALVTALGLGARGVTENGKRALPFRVSTFTDVSGAFRFTGLDDGTYRLSAQKPHFTNAAMARAPVRLESSSKEDVRLELSPLGTIEGKITDQRGEPAPAVSVLVMQTRIEDGWRQASVERTVWTDDHGIFRAWNIAPGRYLIRVTGRGGRTFTYLGEAGSRIGGGFDGFVPAYFGGPAADSATPIVIESGTEARADIGVVVQPAYRVRGTLGNVGAGPVDFALVSGEEDVSAGRVILNRTTGAFEMLEVVNGSYMLRATQGDKAIAELPLVVNGSDVDGVRMALEGPVEVSVNVRILDQPDGPEGQVVPGLRGAPRQIPASCGVTLRGVGPRAEPIMQDGEGGTISALPGRYRVDVSCFGAYLVSAATGTTDLLANPSLAVGAGTAPSPIEVVARHGGGTITGAIKLDQEPAGMTMSVLAVPHLETRDPMLSLAFGKGSFRFSFDAIAPGDYSLYAFSTDQVEYRNPEFLRGLTGGESVHIEDGATATVTITRLAQ